MKNHKVVCIVGPTASGKTALAVRLAKKYDGEIISADSRQIYEGLDIGSGKDLREYGDVKYHLIDIVDPGKEFTLFDWLDRARKTINEIFARGKLPIVVGGTGLYVQALVEGFAFDSSEKLKVKSEKFNSKIKKYTREELDNKSLNELQDIYEKLPATNSKLDLQNPRRVIRAIEIAQEGTIILKKKPEYQILQIGITLPREILYEKIDKRVDGRFKEGMLEEVDGLLKSGVSSNWLHKLGLEYRLISEFLIKNNQADINEEIFKTNNFMEMAQNLKWKIHAFARRQLTWFRRFPDIKWIKEKQEADYLVDNFLKK